jgi:hypothetical protein
MKIQYIRALMLWVTLGFLPLLTSCEKIECGQFDQALDDEKLSVQLLAWADTKFFHGAISADEMSEFGSVGPGRMKYQPSRADEPLPDFVKNLEIRLLGPQPLAPIGIFLGNPKSSFRGLIIANGAIDDVLRFERIPAIEVLKKGQHMAIICRDMH